MTPHLEQQNEALVEHQNEALDVEQVDETKSASLSDSEDSTNWRSIYCTALLAFFTAIQFALFYSSLWVIVLILLDFLQKITKAYFAMYVCQQFPAEPPILNGFPPISMR